MLVSPTSSIASTATQPVEVSPTATSTAGLDQADRDRARRAAPAAGAGQPASSGAEHAADRDQRQQHAVADVGQVQHLQASTAPAPPRRRAKVRVHAPPAAAPGSAAAGGGTASAARPRCRCGCVVGRAAGRAAGSCPATSSDQQCRQGETGRVEAAVGTTRASANSAPPTGAPISVDITVWVDMIQELARLDRRFVTSIGTIADAALSKNVSATPSRNATDGQQRRCWPAAGDQRPRSRRPARRGPRRSATSAGAGRSDPPPHRRPGRTAARAGSRPPRPSRPPAGHGSGWPRAAETPRSGYRRRGWTRWSPTTAARTADPAGCSVADHRRTADDSAGRRQRRSGPGRVELFQRVCCAAALSTRTAKVSGSRVMIARSRGLCIAASVRSILLDLGRILRAHASGMLVTRAARDPRSEASQCSMSITSASGRSACPCGSGTPRPRVN